MNYAIQLENMLNQQIFRIQMSKFISKELRTYLADSVSLLPD